MVDIRIKKDYIILKSPDHVLNYIQRLVNNIRREGLELDPNYLGKIVYLLNTWLSAYKTHLESVEVQQLREEIEDLKRQIEARNGSNVIIKDHSN